jgi:glycosyltransferase involved in cell wall biosynthesis
MTTRAHVERIVRAARRRAADVPLRALRAVWVRGLARTRAPALDRPRLFYGYARLPRGDRPSAGGIVKFQRLADVFPNEPRAFNVLYLGSSSAPRDLRTLLELARRRGARVAWNQDGVMYPGIGFPDVERANAPMRLALHAADHVFFQSEFCKLAADRFLGEPAASWEILYNAVDTSVFAPAPEAPSRPLTLLLAGSQYQWYRLESALRALALIVRERTDARMLVTGRLWTVERRESGDDARRLAHELGLGDRVEFYGPYSQCDAPGLMRRGDLLLHPKYNDPCPGVVIEAMACGLPVVYSASGGVPELVGDDAGIGVPAPLDFERDHPPSPEALAEAVLAVAADLGGRAAAARARAVERFDLRPWIERHRVVFGELCG